MRRAFWLIAALCIVILAPFSDAATHVYINVPAVPGPGAPQGYPSAIAVQSIVLAAKANYFQVTRQVDAITPTFFNDAVNGTPLPNVSALFYKAINEPHAPYLTLNFANTLIGSVSLSGGGQTPTETTRFNYAQATAIYLQIPSRPGIDTAPGYSNLYRLDSAAFDGTGLTINRPTDAARPRCNRP